MTALYQRESINSLDSIEVGPHVRNWGSCGKFGHKWALELWAWHASTLLVSFVIIQIPIYISSSDDAMPRPSPSQSSSSHANVETPEVILWSINADAPIEYSDDDDYWQSIWPNPHPIRQFYRICISRQGKRSEAGDAMVRCLSWLNVSFSIANRLNYPLINPSLGNSASATN